MPLDPTFMCVKKLDSPRAFAKGRNDSREIVKTRLRESARKTPN
jgi:hypothetical protein